MRDIAEQGAFARIRPDQRVVLMRDWQRPAERLKGVAAILTRLVRLAEEGAGGGLGEITFSSGAPPVDNCPVVVDFHP